MKLSVVMKPLLDLLWTDVAAMARVQPSSSRARAAGEPLAPRWDEPGPEQQPDPSIRLMDVLSALPPMQVPDWFRQRFELNPLFRLGELSQLSPVQRRQMLVLVEKTLSRKAHWQDRPQSITLWRFLEQARREEA